MSAASAGQTIATPSRLIHDALRRPSGARFYKTALQINPYNYGARTGRTPSFPDEASYNEAIVEACLREGVEVIAVTDHYRVRSSESLARAARDAGIKVFSGFEAATKEGIHLLVFFDEAKTTDALERIIGDCGIHDEQATSPVGKYDVDQMVRYAREWGGICVAAHVTAVKNGLLGMLKGQARINAWRDSELLACAIPGPVADVPEPERAILRNTNPDYERARPMAIVNARDVTDGGTIGGQGAWTFIKMSEASVEGLRQAFLDPESRIRLATDTPPEDHVEFVAICWEGGFLDGIAIRFNENLNVFIGGRGVGKTTLVESIRYVLDLPATGDDAAHLHTGIVANVLKGGTKITLVIRTQRPAPREYTIERLVNEAPVVRDEDGRILPLRPSDLLPGVEVYGQHEISELTKRPEKLTHLLDRFVARDAATSENKTELRRALEENRRALVDLERQIRENEERVAALPGLEENLARFQEAGLGDKLKERGDLVPEEQKLKTIASVPDRVRKHVKALRAELLAADADAELETMPHRDVIRATEGVLTTAATKIRPHLDAIEMLLKEADSEIAAHREDWASIKKGIEERYQATLRELQRAKIDANQFLLTKTRIAELRPLDSQRNRLREQMEKLVEQRRTLLIAWEDAKGAEFREIDAAAKRVNKLLADRVRVRVTIAGDRGPLERALRESIGGRLTETIETLVARPALSLSELAEAMRGGKGAIVKAFGITPSQADRLAKATTDVVMAIEELDLPTTTHLELNTGGEKGPASWRELASLSTGQKATAVLLLLLLESEGPLVVDQPEDDLDNRFITEGIVPRMRAEKRRRQFVFSTHNANIPVLADAELIVGLSARGESPTGTAFIAPDHAGSIDAGPIRELVEQILEGGRVAFETRRLKYGY